MNIFEKNDAMPSLEEVTNFIRTPRSKATGHISFTYGRERYSWKHVLLVEMARMVLTATHDDSGDPLNGTLMFTFPLTLKAGESMNFGLGNNAACVFVFGSFPSFPAFGLVFKLTHSTPLKHYKGTFSCANMLLSDGEFDISL
ncbi:MULTISPECIES: hypothetical protein [unclassified Pseudomonas]|jgi:hypothetical protein|uniref:hypothetical protein n=1 Tax=unclassified Pseudomonas TaxID=196821 RepID=UPI001CBE68DB|nr:MULTISPECIES: hypothetical protein [unclassified Pseudomonas]